MAGPVFRFAPSPTGRLHRGHAFSALMSWRACRAAKGAFRLRIEDIDRVRCRPEFEAGILEDLAWLGVDWDGPVLRQSGRGAAYEAALAHLAEEGLTYRCFRTRREVADAMTRAPHGDEVVFFGERLPKQEEAARLAAGEAFAWRLDVRAAAERSGPLSFLETGAGPAGETGRQIAQTDSAGDIVLARRDIGVAYHLAVVVDDAFQEVTTVVRGCDLFAATHVQRLLQVLLGLPEPVYRHHRLLVGPDGKRYAKRDRAETLQSLREQGVSPDWLIAELDLDGDR
ncbi:tRNA glutamyl-Q(34) synthetase GluQRS [Phenylobacterium sp.]|uniref:tRNA glutamyl-Q(34) synthetase GluQRS n=1 Tax=Phenylobacterium sp. TaxID=1871053 RepID=UPI0025E2E0E6|nr:tRNA glutamyl-Q(34) synthetase GluQRS [Phenylobacterium sp.]MCA6286176.1 tRNA glutamyl-Q(34) synthetase GluQRS [Phenylobacterium sp.]MCA6289465.1 tRNA glutamyl-Q(34) synthetase GluQRS [Phenylobacterium sp.]MCA6310092.1 tRNA glutamyl-Q(34) synthetase GluQRS [Phenylobacterium sp.]MCA6324401.1 tRNA glutamyl-Q(34) synthetase GluQRS [Phenylobacterium sp.]MCA6336902.1 tRNA glutamyl-Q(34) synthetase GluQRS [Phenylobacterium sp.]